MITNTSKKRNEYWTSTERSLSYLILSSVHGNIHQTSILSAWSSVKIAEVARTLSRWRSWRSWRGVGFCICWETVMTAFTRAISGKIIKRNRSVIVPFNEYFWLNRTITITNSRRNQNFITSTSTSTKTRNVLVLVQYSSYFCTRPQVWLMVTCIKTQYVNGAIILNKSICTDILVSTVKAICTCEIWLLFMMWLHEAYNILCRCFEE